MILAIVGVIIWIVAKLTLIGIILLCVALGLAIGGWLLRGRRGVRAPY